MPPHAVVLPQHLQPCTGHSEGYEHLFKNQSLGSLGASSSKFEELGEELPTGSSPALAIWLSMAAPPQPSSPLQMERPQPRPLIWDCFWEHTAYENRVVIFNQLLSISKMCTLIIHLIYLG